MHNARVADIFEEIADLVALNGGNEFRVRAYRNAARSVRDLSTPLEEIAEGDGTLEDLPDIGEGMAEKIREILETGSCTRLEDLREEVPPGLTEVLDVPGLGPRKVEALHDELGIENMGDLREAVEEHEAREVEGIGARMEEKIARGIDTVSRTSGRVLRAKVRETVADLQSTLEALGEVRRYAVAGSYRRHRETVGDLDIVVEAADRAAVNQAIAELEPVTEVIHRGSEKISVRLEDGLRVDFRYTEAESFGAALLYFTGSQAHTVALRRRAQERGWKLNEYALRKGDHRLAAKTEQAVYHRLDLAWVPPELREERGEIEAAEAGRLPDLVSPDDIRGDLHAHTDASDGRNTIREMAEAARERGLDYLAITDHSTNVSVTQGLDARTIMQHAGAIRRQDGRMDNFRLLAGVEVDILESGELDIDAETLGRLDWVVASVHSHFEQDRDTMTERLLRAIRSGVVHCIGHPTGRRIGKRDGIDFDRGTVFEACAENDVALEIDAQPDRLDLPDIYCREAREAGVRFSIATDAHNTDSLRRMPDGVAAARRGWLEAEDILNTRAPNELDAFLERKRN
jgi:DNA polymerase (family 10)